MTGFSDADIEAALSQPCAYCPARAGEECEEPRSGIPLMESRGVPVHRQRIEP